jgi:alpha-L-rhamnosidase
MNTSTWFHGNLRPTLCPTLRRGDQTSTTKCGIKCETKCVGRGVLGQVIFTLALLWSLGFATAVGAEDELAQGFLNPPDAARPWVYWFVMDGNLSREGITADFEALKRVGIRGVLFMEVDVGIPKGPVKFMSPPWRELFKHANAEAARLGLVMTMPASPGWTGSGGPWVRPEQSMQKLVSTETSLVGPRHFQGALPQPEKVAGFYKDVAVLAFPTPTNPFQIQDISEKALYHRGHFSSEAGVKAVLTPSTTYPALQPGQVIPRSRIVDLTDKLDAGGRLTWDVPEGNWTVLRFGHTSTGANTRPAPEPGLGLECDKFDKAALEAHFENFLGKLMADIGPLTGKSLISLHIDSWEMGPQNWTARFAREFQQRRGYDLLPWLPVMTGRVVENLEVSERFLWDMRQTVLELIADNHAGYLAELAHRHGLGLSIEPYDGTPCDDMTYGSRADVPMGEFWRDTFTTWFSCTEASSIAHTYGKRIVQAEAFTSGDGERWLAHPATLKTLGDWAFCDGINRFVFHRYAHQPWLDRWPGMTMGPYGIHYDRTQTWFELSKGWVDYLSRCQHLLQQGLPVADVCFLKPEASPQVFRPPRSATRGTPPDRLGYSFDAMTPEALLTRASVKNGRLVLPDGMSYRVLVLPEMPTMTPRLLEKIEQLVSAGATVVGPPPVQSPSLSAYPECDQQVKQLTHQLWRDCDGVTVKENSHGLGQVIWERSLEKETPPAHDSLEKAKWIWHREGNPAGSAPVGNRFFRRVVTVDGSSPIATAHMTMTADNAFELWVNGSNAGRGENFHLPYELDVKPLLKPGENVLAVRAENSGDAPNPAGLIGTLVIRFENGRSLEIPTDELWQSARIVDEHWASGAVATTSQWQPALELGALGMAPWGAVGKPIAEPDMYGDFAVVSRLLAKLGISPDFESDGPLRYTHRHTVTEDIYFVANRDDHWVGAQCAFRVTGMTPFGWDPLTGRTRALASFQEKDGRMILPLWLEPAGSTFVVFRQTEPATSDGLKPDPIAEVIRDGQSVLPDAIRPLAEPPILELSRGRDQKLVALAWQAGHYELRTATGSTAVLDIDGLPAAREITGPWDLRFQPNRGAPESIVLPELSDWSKHPDPGVRFFSGTAKYRNKFQVPAESIGPGQRLYLDLGRVQVMAQVTVNGADLGIVWKAPFRVDVTEAVRTGENTLEVTVANLWPNRLIGDQGLSPEKRVAWTTWNPFAKDSPLLESGLLGPVNLQAARSRVISGP